MQGIQKLWFKVILVIQTEVQTNITRQKDRSVLLFNAFAVGNVIPYHCLLKYTITKKWRIIWDCIQQWIQLILFFTLAMTSPLSSWSSTLTLSTSEKRNVLVPLKATDLQLWEREWRGQPWDPTALPAPCQPGRRGSSTSDDRKQKSGSQHAFQQPTRGTRTFPTDALVNQGSLFR